MNFTKDNKYLICAEMGYAKHFVSSLIDRLINPEHQKTHVINDYNEYTHTNAKWVHRIKDLWDYNDEYMVVSHSVEHVSEFGPKKYDLAVLIEAYLPEGLDIGWILKQIKSYRGSFFNIINDSYVTEEQRKFAFTEEFENFSDLAFRATNGYLEEESYQSLLMSYTDRCDHRSLNEDNFIDAYHEFLKIRPPGPALSYKKDVETFSYLWDEVIYVNYEDFFFKLELPEIFEPFRDEVIEYSLKNLDLFDEHAELTSDKQLANIAKQFRNTLINSMSKT